jgi:rhomboid protease GluP
MDNTEKKSMLCPNCRKLISSDEPACPYCGLKNPGSWWKSNLGSSLLNNPADAVNIIIGVNIVFFVLSLLINPSRIGMSGNPLAFLSPSDNSLFALGATGTIPIRVFHRWWTLGSASFLHGGILHIAFNMLALRQLGPFVIFEYGLNRFIVIYLFSGVAGFALSTVAGIPFTIGASASICGLIGAILYYGKSRGGIYGQAIYKQATGWVMGLIVMGLLLPGINNWAHGGGIIAGILMCLLLKYNDRGPETILDRMASIFCILATALVLAWSVAQLFLR